MGNAERMRAMFDAFNERRLADATEFLDEQVVFDARGYGVPGIAKVFFGIDEIGGFWGEWLASWRHVQADIAWLEERGDRVVAWVHQTMTGRESGAETRVEYAWDARWRDGKLIRAEFTLDEAEARRRAGLD